MLDTYDYTDEFGTSTYPIDVGPTNNGTYNVPAAAQPVNQQWDTGGGTLGQYGNDVLTIISQGVGAWSQYMQNQQLLDYKRFEATQGGVYQQGASTQIPLNGTVTARATFSPLTLLLLAGGAYLLLRK